ncbi:MAG: glycosyltransferase [Thiohalocapsa sp.]|nr:glycosyltransferase [Thiohalocapsa sp.]
MLFAHVGRRRYGWRLLALLPAAVPDDDHLASLCRSPWADYQRWLRSRCIEHSSDWLRLRRTALSWRCPPRITLVVPIFETDPDQLDACIASVRYQSYPFWQLCLADDCSPSPDALDIALAHARCDPRLQVRRLERNIGICGATNRAISIATGDYVGFLDHDDMLAPDALHRVAEAIRADPAADVFYSDRDMLSEQGGRFMHLLKPAWSPETLLAGNYIFHLTVYRRALLERLGGLRAEYEGSQDYDLILRASEITDRIRHIPRVLYHWREHAVSIATNAAAKGYVYDAGKAALRDAMRRRGLATEVTDVEGFRGHYRPELPVVDPGRYEIALLPAGLSPETYRERLVHVMDNVSAACEFVVVLGGGLTATSSAAIAEMVRWLQLPGVGFVTGRVVDADSRIVHAGLVLRAEGVPLNLFQGQPATNPGYMAYAAVMRNVAVPHPYCVAFRRAQWDAAGGLSTRYVGPHAMLDLAMRAAGEGWRALYVPYAEFSIDDASDWKSPWALGDAPRFAVDTHSMVSAGDRYFPLGMRLDRHDMALDQTPPALPAMR